MNVVHDNIEMIHVSVRAQYHSSGGSPYYRDLEHWHPAFGWVKRQHRGGSLKSFQDFFSF